MRMVNHGLLLDPIVIAPGTTVKRQESIPPGLLDHKQQSNWHVAVRRMAHEIEFHKK